MQIVLLIFTAFSCITEGQVYSAVLLVKEGGECVWLISFGSFQWEYVYSYWLSHLVWQPYLLTFSWRNTRRFFKLGQYNQDYSKHNWKYSKDIKEQKKKKLNNSILWLYTGSCAIIRVEYFTWNYRILCLF